MTVTLQMSEKELQSAVVELARWRGWLVYHPYDSRRSEPGFPDLTLVRGDTLLFVELKSAKGRVSEAQQEWIDALRESGHDVYVWRPEHWIVSAIDEVLA